MPNPINITNIPPPRVDFIDPKTGLIAREWYRFFVNLFNLTGAGTNEISLTDLQVGPPAINSVLGELGIVYDQAQIASMMAQYEQAVLNIQNQIDTAPSAPQLGTLASQNADNVRLIGFSTSPSPAVPNPAPTGTLYWDGNSTLGVQMNQSVLAKIGQGQFVYVKASAAITKGQLCKHTGAVGGSGVITSAPTSLAMTDTTQIIGVAAQDIALNDFGFVQVAGDLRGFNTTGSSVGETWADGDPLYYNPAYVGSFTKVKPSAPNLKTYIGEVINSGSGGSGSINIHLVYGSTLGGTDSNVQLGTVSDKDLIQYDSTAQYWKNVAASSISIGTATNLAGGAAGSVPYQSAASTTTFLPLGTASQVLQVNAGATAPEWVTSTGTGNVVRATSPTLTTPTITTSATVPLVIGGTGTTSTITLRSTSGVGATGADIIFQTGNNGATEAMRVLNSGNVGVGTNNPGVKLDVSGTIRSNTTSYPNYQYNTANRIAFGETVVPPSETGSVVQFGSGLSSRNMVFAFTKTGVNTSFFGNDGTQMMLGSEGSAPITFRTGLVYGSSNIIGSGTEAMRISSSGSVGIGTASNLSNLTVNGAFASKSPSTVNAATYTVAATDSSLRFTTTNCTITLPTAASFPGRILYLNTITANSVTSAASNVIPLGSNTAGTAIFAATAGKFAMIQSDGTNWITMMAN